MTTFLMKLRAAGAWLWPHVSAAVALLLIVAALILGYWIGRPAPDEDEPGAAVAAAGADGEQQMYTCSMHPTVRLPDPNAKCPICHMDLIPVRGGGGSGSAADQRRILIDASAAAASRIETMPAARFFPTAEVRLYGKVSYDETSVARLTAYFGGRIERLFVNYVGVPVARGDHLAEIYSPDLIAAFEELRQAQLASEDSGDMTGLVRESARQTLRAARERLRLFGLTSEQIGDIERGEHDSDRLTVYAPIGGIVTDLAAREGDYLDTGDPIATVADLSRLWLDLEAYESQLPLLRWGQPVTFTVEAQPGQQFEGRISFIEPTVDERMRTAAVRVAVDNSDRRLKPGMFASAIVRPRIGAGGAIISDELAGKWVGPMHPSVVKDEPGQCDICGMDLVPAESLGVVGDVVSGGQAPIVIPRSAVLFTGVRSLVYVEDPDAENPTYEPREVTLGLRAGDDYIVRDGLEEVERIVVNGAFRVDSAMQIAGKPSMMAPEGGGGAGGHGGHGGHGAAPSPQGSGSRPSQGAAVPDAFITSLAPVYSRYLDAQEALAADDFEAFTETAAALRDEVESVQPAGLRGEALGRWRRIAADLSIDPGDPALGDIEAARVRFEPMSEAIIALHRTFGRRGGETGGEALHIAHCPMAFDFKGADWLQRGETINNPYFGASMLRCGDIEESLPPLDAGQPQAPEAPAAPEAPGADPHEGHDHG